jgi:hypothetical protein
MNKTKKALQPLVPAATEEELNAAARVWTEAQANMVERGYTLVLWGNQHSSCHEFVVLMLRAAARRPSQE